ncbi:MAG: YbaB/EbfC family nucleoid-associated protein [Candidatus Buchananbacteria bacterium]|nr:YbaB/EbfC family nucleoid-associated protein [Candidatus Buchananbacteria bacterium]
MLDKLKQLKQLKSLHDAAKSERFEASKDGVKIVINGNMQIEELVLNPELDTQRQAQVVKECFNDAIRNAQMGMAQKLQSLNIGL